MFTKSLSKYATKKILIVGMAREGLSTTAFLAKYAPHTQLFITDTKPLDQLSEPAQKLIKENDAVTFLETEAVTTKKFDFIFKSPGIPYELLEKTYNLSIPKEQVSSNTQLFFDIVHDLQAHPTVIGVTGTKGKSTTTSHIYHVLSSNLPQVKLGGNIGLPPLRLLEDEQSFDKTIFVLEMSSHQLAELRTSPTIAVVQDISPDHLDYYPDFETYLQAKTAICKFQKTHDTVLYNADSKTATRVAQLSSGEKIPYSKSDQKLISFIKESNSPLLGEHNFYNIIPSVLIAQKLGLADAKIREAIHSFKAVPHRIELVKNQDGIRFYNDSAASAPEATIAAIKAFENNPLILIVGGSEKKVSFTTLAQEIIQSNCKYLILFPDTGLTLLEEIKKLSPDHLLVKQNQVAHSMKEAVEIAQENAIQGDVVLLSPASASFNMFKNYEDRGNQFRSLVTQSEH